MMWLLTSWLAHASSCPDVEVLVDRAAAAFDDAEVDVARQRLAQASAVLVCQRKVVPRQTLIDLYHLDALASVAAQDPKAALYAIIRAVTLDPDVAPPPDVGPELIGQHQQWAARLRENQLLVSATTSDVDVWIDGRAVDTEPMLLVSGEHYVQMRDGELWASEVIELAVGRPVGLAPLRVRRPPPPADPPQITTRPDPQGPPPGPRRRVALGVGIASAIAGGALFATGAMLERSFRDDPYLDSYGGCDRGQPCWTDARAQAIGADARRANAFLLSGYLAGGLGVGLVGVDLALGRTSGGVQVRGAFR